MRNNLLVLILFLFLCSPAGAKLHRDSGKQTYSTKIGVDDVIIGDEKKSSEFKPAITFTRWNKENSLKIIPPVDLINSSSATLTGENVETKDSKIGFYFNPDPDNAENFKFGLILYEKPKTNIFTFQIEGWEDFDFFYQPPLEHENTDGSTWEGEIGKYSYGYRPAKVNGSWAIYHKTKKDYIIGQTDYGCGKFGHIMRPKFIDASGDWIWGTLDIKNSNYIITVPQNFLDKAVYPIKSNDEWGYTTVGGSQGSWDLANDHVAAYVTGVAPAGVLNYISFYMNPPGSSTFKYAIYSDNTLQPSNLLASDASAFSVSSGAGWKQSAVNLNYTMSVGAQYWFDGMMITGSSGTSYYYDTGDYRYYINLTSFPNPWTDYATGGTRKITVKGVYTVGGSTARRSPMVIDE